MKNILILFSSTDGHTLKISNYIKDILLGYGFKISIFSLDHYSKIDIKYDFILIGASIRYGNYNQSLYKFIENNLQELELINNGFFSVSATARKKGRDIPELDNYFKKFKEKTKWKPSIVGVFPGAINYPKYNIIDRYMIKFIMYLTNGPTNLSKTFEFTDWNKVSLFAIKIVDILKYQNNFDIQ
ncbi:menaquinone-dependent protoporphyrinogen IX dehydrogenase [Acinetobacter baumannii]